MRNPTYKSVTFLFLSILCRSVSVLGFGARSLSLGVSSNANAPSRSCSYRVTSTVLLSASNESSSSSSGGGAEKDHAKIAVDVFAGSDQRPIVLFDGVCNLCNGGVNFALDNDASGKFRFASLQSRVGQALLVRAGKNPDDISSIVLCEPNKTYFKSDAVLKIARKLDGSLPILGFMGPVLPSFLRNIVYDFVANNRYRFGEADQCRIDAGEFNDRFISDPSPSS